MRRWSRRGHGSTRPTPDGPILPPLDIAICGAGPAGLAAALFLHRAGHRVTVFERFETARPLGSGLILQPTGLTVLGALGLLPAMLELGSRIERLHGADAATGRTVLDVRYASGRNGRFGLAVHRAALFGVLHRAVEAAGLSIETGRDVDALDETGRKPRLVYAGGTRTVSFDLVVDASGARSRLKRHVAVASEPRALAYGAFWASLAWRGGFDPHALSQRYRQASVMIGVMPIGRVAVGETDQAAFFWSLKPDDAAAVQARGLDAWKDRVRSLWPETEACLGQIDGFEQLTLARYGHHTLHRPAGRRLAVIGDAAHSTSPQLGQGANMALLDAAALAHALASTDDIADALARYCQARRLHVRLFQALSLAFTPFYQSDSRLVPLLRDTLVSSVARVPPAPAILAALVSGMLADPLRRIGLAEPDWSVVAAATAAPAPDRPARP
ncbi:FAD-dependent monooxygenase [Aquibium carbonis]|uniref:FAD-dependent monooxygenase n=1 Tax=Aquibium carbonis TaxID=2495581 RepID=A0A429YS98_9HYPH|nr:NAD(P)/FAD-dependent oxidoreductase [Aquibium carbonis]RST84336.1 FAD-dependent monooxygenase [Aquibium carbonis]